ncbi:MAG TPA: 1,4-dihydroxy-2-naphthoate polyprenyltransferase [Acidimicrobiales bacterium]|nr:1,4-dihydroxy-2-naphthoate polyprenyltransferase [Acidimicrobiales bacterium]
MTTAREWVAGARPRTLPAAVVPVAVGTAVAAADGYVIWWRSLYALIVALSIQIGTNYANDYSDGVRGTDAERVGPVRLVAGGLAHPREVRMASFWAFGVAAVAGLVLALATTPWLLVVGAVCVAAGWFYTGGPRPYGYAGFGEIFVFVFFGLVAVIGTAYLSLGRITVLAVVAAVPVGLLATALLVVNNLRDLQSDRRAGKHTLAVRIGAGATRRFYGTCVIGALALVVVISFWRPAALIALLAVIPALPPLRRVLQGAEGRDLVTALVGTGTLQLAFGALLAAGIAL